MRLNKYIAHTGHCTRREASRLLLKGEIKVNGEVVNTESYRVMEGDIVTHLDKPLSAKVDYRYLLINKPIKFSTDKDDKDSKYIMGLIKSQDPKGLQCVTEMGPDSVGLLLLTDDNGLIAKLNEPNRKLKRVYLITLDREISKADIKKLVRPRKTLQITSASHVSGYEHNVIGIELSIGNEALIRRTLTRMDYSIKRLDCNYYAGLTKKDLKRGWSRPLKEMEERMMKHFI